MDKREMVEALQARSAELRKQLDNAEQSAHDTLMLLREIITIDDQIARIDA